MRLAGGSRANGMKAGTAAAAVTFVADWYAWFLRPEVHLLTSLQKDDSPLAKVLDRGMMVGRFGFETGAVEEGSPHRDHTSGGSSGAQLCTFWGLRRVDRHYTVERRADP